MVALRGLIFAAFLLVIAFLLAILGCTIVPDSNALPLIPLALTLITPIPFVLCGRPQGTFSDEGVLDGIGLFLGGALAVSGPAMSCVLFHTGGISLRAFFFSLGSEVVLAITAAVLGGISSNGDEDEEYDF